MKKFEYKTITLSRTSNFWTGADLDITQLEELLNQMGNDGWELVTSIEKSLIETNDYFCLIFKRELQIS